MNKKFKMVLLGVLSFLALPVAMALAGGNELAYFKIQSLTQLDRASIAAGDYIPIYDASADKVKKLDAFTGLGFAGPKIVNVAVDTALTAAAHANRTLVMGGAGSQRTFTLPAATGTGDTYTLIAGAVNTSNYRVSRAGSDVIKGGLIFASDNAANAELGFETTSAVLITLNGTTTGGAAIGDYVILTDIASGVWAVRGQVTESGSEATPFS